MIAKLTALTIAQISSGSLAKRAVVSPHALPIMTAYAGFGRIARIIPKTRIRRPPNTPVPKIVFPLI
jgi:hypothetical protein